MAKMENKPNSTGYRCVQCHKTAYHGSDGLWYHAHPKSLVCYYGRSDEVYAVDMTVDGKVLPNPS